jgi:hypothetical protein
MYTPQSNNDRLQDLWAENDGHGHPNRTAEELAQRRVSDCERTAIWLLRKALRGHVWHVGLSQWIEQIIEDAAYAGTGPATDRFGALQYEDEVPDLHRRSSDAAYALAIAVVEHRLHQEDGEMSGLPLAIVNYYNAMCDWHYRLGQTPDEA